MKKGEVTPIEFRNMVIKQTVIAKILKESNNPLRVLGLYTLYHYKTIWPDKKHTRCTNAFAAKALKCSVYTIRKSKKELLDLNLI